MRLALVVIGCVGCGGGASPELPCGNTGPDGVVIVRASPDQTIVFHDAHGATVSSTTTDAAGDAVGVIPACGAITVATTPPTSLFTVTQLQPGDTVIVRAPAPFSSGTHRSLSIDFPLLTGTTQYEFKPARSSESCVCTSTFATSSPAIVDLDECCLASDRTTAITAIAHGHVPASYATLEHVPVPEIVSNTATINGWRVEQDHVRFTISDLPDPGWTGSVGVVEISGTLAMQSIGLTSVTVPGELDIARLGDRAVVSASVQDPVSGLESFLFRVHDVPLAATMDIRNVDFAPYVTSVIRHNDEPGRPVIEWTTSRPTDDQLAILINTTFINGGWLVIAPAGQPGAIRFPELPEGLRPAEPLDAAFVGVLSSVFTDYTDARQLPLTLLMPSAFRTRADPDGFTYRLSQGRTPP